MNNIGNAVNASRRACYCNQFQTVISRVRTAVRIQKCQRDKVLPALTVDKARRTFPLPGFVGPADLGAPTSSACLKRNPPFQLFCFNIEDQRMSDVFNELNHRDKRLSSINQQLTADSAMNSHQKRRAQRTPGMRVESDQVECVVQECSEKMRGSFSDLFPSGFPDQLKENMSAVIISHKTKNDMSIWSSDMELERDELTSQFVDLAKEIVETLKANEVWADFIDPSSGRPFYSPYTNATLFETDDRYKQFGFGIQDLGCCKCLEHPLWGANAFIGCILTSASSSHPVLKEIIHSKIE